MKKILYSAFCAAVLVGATACEDFLETSSPSIVDENFVFSNIETARKAMDGAYEAWRQVGGNHAFGDGLYYAADVTGSDIERHPEGYGAQLQRHRPEGLYENGHTNLYTLNSYEDDNKSYSLYLRAYTAIGQANAVISSIRTSEAYAEFTPEQPTELSQLYGEAVAMVACCYRELIRYYGDVPYGDADGLTSRHAIYDNILADLVEIEPLMYRLGEGGVDKDAFSRTFVQGLIGRIALDAAAYQTHRSDMEYIDGEGEPVSFEKLGQPNANADNAFYARRSNYLDFYQMAKIYYKKVLDNSGTARLLTVDPRAAEFGGKRVYGNPYQYFFQEMHMGDEHFATESIYEIVQTMGNGNHSRPYSFGRPAAGGSSRSATAGYPCKNYGQGRINPAYYYGIFDPNDMRRDVSITVTGPKGDGTEVLIPVAPQSQVNGGGISLNKWDECRQVIPYAKQRSSGINGPYMRMAEIYLGYAEACAVTGDEAEAKNALKTIRERSFPAGKANTDAFIASCENLLDAVVEERGFEFAGEGDRRWTLIRTGLIGPKIKRIKDLTADMMAGLAANHSYTFKNGNVISDYVYVKPVNTKADPKYGFCLTAECQDKTDPVLYPGWRGQHDDWVAVGAAGGFNVTFTTMNLAIKGLFEPVDGTALEADGYERKEWGKAFVEYKTEYLDNLFKDYDYTSAPVYLWPFTINTLLTGGFTNGYGFAQE